jgi:alginate O-acetyltransferase complex protein AlgI
MVFNSLPFLVFFIIVTSLYFLLKPQKRWFLLLIASCYFYMAYLPLYILILGFTIVIDYIAGIYIEQAVGRKRKLYLIISLCSNIGILAFFKYANFMVFNINQLMWLFHSHHTLNLLHILLPIGLSFHTFQAMSYTIEVYRGNQKAERHFGIYSLYVMFYPQLVAGPIERPQNLLHQFREVHNFDHEEFKAGLLQMGRGFYKKCVIADRIAILVDYSYANYQTQSGLSLCIAVLFYAFQIYCDFSGYSDIALGAARIMGIKLMTNFNAPFQSKNITEFWRRWHISLSTWFNDYLFTGLVLANRDLGKIAVVFSLLITFLISGLWHGAGWNFVIFGALHGLAVIYEFLSKKFRKKLAKSTPAPVYNNLSMVLTFVFACFTWIFFRSQGTAQSFEIINKIAHLSFADPLNLKLSPTEIAFSLLLIVLLLLKEKLVPQIRIKNNFTFYSLIALIAFSCYMFGVFNNKQFIYFQF